MRTNEKHTTSKIQSVLFKNGVMDGCCCSRIFFAMTWLFSQLSAVFHHQKRCLGEIK